MSAYCASVTLQVKLGLLVTLSGGSGLWSAMSAAMPSSAAHALP